MGLLLLTFQGHQIRWCESSSFPVPSLASGALQHGFQDLPLGVLPCCEEAQAIWGVCLRGSGQGGTKPHADSSIHHCQSKCEKLPPRAPPPPPRFRLALPAEAQFAFSFNFPRRSEIASRLRSSKDKGKLILFKFVYAIVFCSCEPR